MNTYKSFRWILAGALVASSLFAYCPAARASAALGSVTLTAIKCRIFTPNGDGYNDKARFELDNPEQLPVGGSIFDVSGARVASIQQGSTPDYLVWDGKDEDGKVVAGGVYIYQIEFQGKHATGTLAVAR